MATNPDASRWLRVFQPRTKGDFEMSLQKMIYALVAALFVSFSGVTFAAAGNHGVPSYTSADNPAQAQTPPDCKKDPKDPRCKGK